jgi:hypothetical protein
MTILQMRGLFTGLVLLAALSTPELGRAANTLAPDQAALHIGKQVTVCGQVASATFASHTRRQPTFLNLDKPYPDHIFTVLVWGEDRGAFNLPPEVMYRNRHICVTGVIKTYKGRPEIVVTAPAQIVVKR